MSNDTETLAEYIDRNNLTMEAEQVGASERPGAGTWPDGSMHFKCAIHREGSPREGSPREVVVYYSQGPAVASWPELADVLSCIAGDIATVENAEDKWDWMEEFGMVSQEGEEAWNTIQDQRDALQSLLGPGNLDRLLWCTAW